jgi:alcohol dehydrogenase
LSFEEAALFGCAVLTGVGAVVNTAQVRAGQSVVVVGLGGVGLASVLGALACGASPVIAVDLSEGHGGRGEVPGVGTQGGAADAVVEDGALARRLRLLR